MERHAKHGQAQRERTLRPSAQKEGKTKLFSSAELLLAKKDLATIWAKNNQRALLILLPIVLVVVIPAVYFVAISLLPIKAGAKLPEALLALLPEYVKGLDYRQGWVVVFVDLLCPLLFSCVPILTAAASASYAFVNERESGTLETLLLTSMDVKAVFNTKVTNCTLLSVLISAMAFAAFGITAIVAAVFAEVPLFFNFEWLILLTLLMPALSLFSVVFVALIINRVHSTGESLQTMGYLILPVACLYLAQLTGILRLNWLVLLIAAAVLGIADIMLFNRAARSFTPEKLLVEDVLE